MPLLKFADVLAIAGLWFAVPLITLRLVTVFRAALPRWERQVSVGLQWVVFVVLIIAVPILALRLFVFLADRVFVHRSPHVAGESHAARTPRIVQWLQEQRTHLPLQTHSERAHPADRTSRTRRAVSRRARDWHKRIGQVGVQTREWQRRIGTVPPGVGVKGTQPNRVHRTPGASAGVQPPSRPFRRRWHRRS
jgi:hypothetical protein